ncbi:MAG: hypothetical protein COA76_00170 [Moritella sp.]|nr:MAG: hypothetical protein COA76_00170 [Moritella sp.]
MSIIKKTLLTSVMLAASWSALANVDNLLSAQSFTGALLTPNAQVIDYGDFSLLYGQGVPFQNHIADLDNLFFAAGFAPGFEAGGRIVTQTYSCNLYTESGCGIRDLSASAKFQLPFVYDYTGFNVAIGGQDIGGAANNFATYYAVADYEFDAVPVRFSAGYGKSDMTMGIMDGPFGSIELQPLPFVQLVGEYDSTELNGAVKLFTPEDLLPYGAQIALQYQVYTSHESANANKENETMWALNASMPFMNYNFSQADAYAKDKTLALSDTIHIAQAQSASASLTELKKALVDEGFINVQLGSKDAKIMVSLENRRYNHNQMDGVGVALGIISSHLGSDIYNDLGIEAGNEEFELFTLVNDLPMMRVNASAVCYREFVKTGEPCADLKFSTYMLTEVIKEGNWLEHNNESDFGRTQVILSPALQHYVATEYGVFDYSLALATNVYTRLWTGAAVDVRHLLPVANSDDYDEGERWNDNNYESAIDRILIHQAFRLPFDVTNQASFGVIYTDYQGFINETNWTSPEGRHSFSFQISQFSYTEERNNNGVYMEDRDTTISSYTLSVPEWSWQANIESGNYWGGDSGFKITSTHWLGDAKLEATYQSTKTVDSDENEDFISLNVSIPLTLWRDMKPGYVQLRGTEQFTYGLQTRIGKSHNNLNTGMGSSINLQHSLARQYYNDDRMSPGYFEANVFRLRNAYLKYLTL